MKKQNNIFVLSSSNKRLEMFARYYNVFKEETNQQITLIVDDRRISRDKIFRSNIFHNILYATDIIEELRPKFTNCDYYDMILNIYPVSIKMLIFIYAYYFLGINKSMLIDDDTLFLCPIDYIFEKDDYVVKKEFLSKMTHRRAQIFADIFDIENFVNQFNKNLINSGTMLYTYKEKHDLLGDVQKFYNSGDIFAMLYENYCKNIMNGESNRTTSGRVWITEQYFYGIHFLKLKLSGETITDFGQAVALYTTYIKENAKKIKMKKLPNIMHFVPKNKENFYNFFSNYIDDYVERNKKQ